jgi:hypothetical protein
MAAETVWGYSQGWVPDRTQTDISTMAYYVMDRVVKCEPAAEALYHEKSQMGTTQDINWVNIMGMNLYGSPTTRFIIHEPVELPPAKPVSLAINLDYPNDIVLSWTDSSDNELGFKIERSRGSAGLWEQIATTDADVETYTDHSLVCGIAYDYRIRAFNDADNSDYSNMTTSSVIPCVPDAPSNFVALRVSSAQINLTWKDNSNDEEGFRLDRSSDGIGWTIFKQLPENTKSLEDHEIDSEKSYFYRIQAYNLAGYSDYAMTAKADPFDIIIYLPWVNR